MKMATNCGTTCKGETLNAASKAIFKVQSNCSVTGPVICNIAKIPAYNATFGQKIITALNLSMFTAANSRSVIKKNIFK